MRNAGKTIRLFEKEEQIKYLESAINVIDDKALDEMFEMNVAAAIPPATVDSTREYQFAEDFKELVDEEVGKIYKIQKRLKALLEIHKI